MERITAGQGQEVFMVAYSRLLREPARGHRILFVGALAAALVLGSLVSAIALMLRAVLMCG